MNHFLYKIRKPVKISLSKKIVYSTLLFGAGIVLGILSKFLDETPSNLLPPFLEMMDLRNFFSRMGIWLFLGIVISIYSKTPLRASINVFLFFSGMVSSYYLYTVTIAGFFPKSYMMIWIAMTFLSLFLAYICWFAKGDGGIAIFISAAIVLFMSRQTFIVGFWYLDVINILELLLWIATIFVLYQSPKQIGKVIIIGSILFILTSPFSLFWRIDINVWFLNQAFF